MHFASSNFDVLQCDVAFYYANVGQGFVRNNAAHLVAQYNKYLSHIEPSNDNSPYEPMPFYDPIPFGYQSAEIDSNGNLVAKNDQKDGDPGGRTYIRTEDNTFVPIRKTTGTTKNKTPTAMPIQEESQKLPLLQNKSNEGPPSGSQTHVKSLSSLLNNSNAKRRIKKNASKKKTKTSSPASVQANSRTSFHRKQHPRNHKQDSRS